MEHFANLEDFLRKATLHEHYFNLARPNGYKGERTPWDIVSQDHPEIRPEIIALPPVLLEAEFLRLDQLDQNVPGLADSRSSRG